MNIQKVTSEDLQKALFEVNKKYEDNIKFNNFKQKASMTFLVTLKCKDSKKAGHRRGAISNPEDNCKGRLLINACWHVHGHFFEQLFKVNPNARVRTGKDLITIEGGNWQDRNIGSLIYPLWFSEACDCD